MPFGLPLGQQLYKSGRTIIYSKDEGIQTPKCPYAFPLYEQSRDNFLPDHFVTDQLKKKEESRASDVVLEGDVVPDGNPQQGPRRQCKREEEDVVRDTALVHQRAGSGKALCKGQSRQDWSPIMPGSKINFKQH